MPRARRQIVAKQPYELCVRTRTGLPFPPNGVINLLIKSGIARVQRDCKVILCHQTWMGNHAHILVVAQDAENFKRFYTELQKYVTECLKRLLGIEHLLLWEGRPMVAIIGDAGEVINRIAYIYANPARANLVDSIELYPGVSSFRVFERFLNGRVEDSYTEEVPFIRISSIEKLGTRVVTPGQERNLLSQMTEEATETHLLVIQPNLWMTCFGITDDKVSFYNNEAMQTLRSNEAGSRKERIEKGFSTFGAEKLKIEPIYKPHIPKKKERKIYFLASTKEIRLQLYYAYQEFAALCKAALLSYLAGDSSVDWPPGSFKPPLTTLANALA